MQTFTALEYLKIDIASNFGMDKENWDVRLNWFEEHKDNLLSMLNKAKEPALYYAGVTAYTDHQCGRPSGYPVSLDGTSSGMQILAALTGDRAAAKACNVIDTGNRNDAYTIVYDRMLAKTGGTAKITREDCKDAVMTSLYGSKAVPKEVFGEGSLLAVFFETMGESAPAVWELNEAFLSIWNPEAYEYNWTLPDNFHVKTKVIQSVTETVHFLDQNFDTYRKINAPTEEGRSLGANCTHSVDGLIVREITRRCNYDQSRVTAIMQMITTYCDLPMSPKDDEMVNILWNLYKESGYLSARILDHLGSTNYDPTMKDDIVELIDSLPSKPFEVVSIHDCFRVLPNYANDLRMQYNRQLYLIAKSEMLSFLLSQIIERTVNVGKLDSDLYMDILDTNYSLS